MTDTIAIGSPLPSAPQNCVVMGFNAVAKEDNTFVVAWGSPNVQVVIHSDGRIDLPPGWSPENSAHAFWIAIGDVIRYHAGDHTPSWVGKED